MKKVWSVLFIAAFYVALGLSSFAQKVINDPLVGFDSANPNVKITKVVLTDSNTVLHFTTKARTGSWINIPRNTYIQVAHEEEKLFVRNSEGIPLNKKYTVPESGMVSYQLIFPAIDPQSVSLDYGEDMEGGWKIYDVDLIRTKRALPTAMYTEWFNQSNGELKLAFYHKAAVLNNQVWSYKKIKENKNQTFTIELENKQQVKQLVVKLEDKDLILTEDKKTSKLLDNRDKCNKVLDHSVFEAPYMKSDSAVFMGYIKNYTPRLNTRNMSLYIDNIITGNQSIELIPIQEDGSFYKKLPLYHFQQAFLRSNISNVNDIYLEPGKDLFIILGSERLGYAGRSAGLNYDLSSLKSIQQFNYNKMQRLIVNMKPDDYKAYLLNLQAIESRKLDSIYGLNLISAKAYQIKKLDIPVAYANQIMEYHWNFPYAYKRARKLNDTVEVKVEKYPDDYYNFINTSFNKPENLLAPSFDTYLNRLRFIDQFRSEYTYNYKEIISLMKELGYNPNAEDKSFEQLIVEDGLSIRTDSANEEIVGNWHNKYQDMVKLVVQRLMREQYLGKVDSALGLKKGICVDLMITQEILRPIVEQLTPQSADNLSYVMKPIENPFIRNYVIDQNQEVIRQVEANKKNGGYFVHSTPTVEADKIFETILAKYKGKAVLVDFWATWCGPCLNGIKEIAPLKEDFLTKNVEFVYITNETSPLTAYNNMTPTIKGQHYRLKPDEWRYLAEKFRITGIPHMVLVNKEGKVVKPKLQFVENNEMKKLLEEQL